MADPCAIALTLKKRVSAELKNSPICGHAGLLFTHCMLFIYTGKSQQQHENI